MQMQKQENPTTPDLVRRSISSSEQRKAAGSTQQNQQNYGSLQKYQNNGN